MRKLLITIAAIFTICFSQASAEVFYISPISFQRWSAEGNFFPAGFQGFLNYFTWLTPSDRAKYIERNNFSSFLNSQSESEWRKKSQSGLSKCSNYSYGVTQESVF